MALLWILSMSDGNQSLLDIAKKSGVDFEITLQAANDLLKVGLLTEVI